MLAERDVAAKNEDAAKRRGVWRKYFVNFGLCALHMIHMLDLFPKIAQGRRRGMFSVVAACAAV